MSKTDRTYTSPIPGKRERIRESNRMFRRENKRFTRTFRVDHYAGTPTPFMRRGSACGFGCCW